MKNNKFSEISGKVSGVLEGLSSIAAVVAPHVAAPVILASKALKKLSEVDSEDAEKSIGGLTLTVNELILQIEEYKKTGTINIEKLEDLAENIKVIDDSLDKFYHIIS